MRLNLTTVCHLFFVRCFEDVFFKNGLNSIDVTIFKIFLLLYVDDIFLFADSKAELQTSLNVLYDYCQKRKLVVNTNQTKIMVFQKRGRLSNNLKFFYNNSEIEIVNNFTYLGIVFSTGGSFSHAQLTLSHDSPVSRIVDVDLFDVISEDVLYFEQLGSVLLAGDWNASVGKKIDYIDCDIANVSDIDDYEYRPDMQGLPRLSV